MAKKRPKVNLTQSIQPRTGDLEKLFARAQESDMVSSRMPLRPIQISLDGRSPMRDWPNYLKAFVRKASSSPSR